MTEDRSVHSATIKKRRGPSIVWLLPVIALIVSAWMIYKSILDKGPEISIIFNTAEGLEVENTRFKLRNVEIGRVKKIAINHDLKTVRVTAQMDKGTERFFRENTRFWVVRPHVGVAGISGLSTILTGSYIEVDPGEGKPRKNFIGLEDPPALSSEEEGTHYTLKSENVRYIGIGAPIHFHGEKVGKVLGRSLTEDGHNAILSIFIRTPFDRLVRSGTQFWIDSGVTLEAGSDGFNLRMGPVFSLLVGGISFKIPDNHKQMPLSEPGSVFRLYDSLDQTKELIYTHTLSYTLHFEDSIRGLKVGAPIELRGIPVGKVTDIDLEIDRINNEVRVPVRVALDLKRLGQSDSSNETSDQAFMDQLIKDGLRAQLQTGSLLTGQLFVMLDFYPDEPLLSKHQDASGKLELPTIPSTLEQFADTAKDLTKKLASMPLDQISKELVEALAGVREATAAAQLTLKSAQKTLSSVNPELGPTLVQFQKTMDSANVAMQHASNVLGTLEKGSTLHSELQRAMTELTDAARAMRELANYLQRNPDALIRGKSE